MAVVAEVSLPTEAFRLGSVFETHPTVRIELERSVPAGKDHFPNFWVYGDGVDAVESTMREQDHVETLERIVETEEGMLFSATWRSDVDGVIDVVQGTACCLLNVVGTSQEWVLQIRFPGHEQVIEFYATLTERRIPVTVQRQKEVTSVEEDPSLSQQQREALLLAYRRGYFGVPRRCKLSDLADQVGISNSAFSERLRRAVATLVEQIAVDD